MKLQSKTLFDYRLKRTFLIFFPPGSYLFRGPSDQTDDLSVSFTIENGLSWSHAWVIWVDCQTNMVYSVDDASLISMITTTTDQQFGPTDHGTSMTPNLKQ